jgi:hypothetical protein
MSVGISSLHKRLSCTSQASKIRWNMEFSHINIRPKTKLNGKLNIKSSFDLLYFLVIREERAMSLCSVITILYNFVLLLQGN